MKLIEKEVSLGMDIIELLVRAIYYTICGWTGSMIMRLLTLGKVDIAWGLDCDAETPVAEWIGSFFWVFVAMTTVWAI